jgi:uncharacterized protein YqeY
MADCALKHRIVEDMKNAMRAKDKERLGIIRLILAAIKQREVDERIELTDTDILVILDKMLKQRRDSISQFESAGRHELAAIEKFEIGIIQEYLPEQLSETEIADLIKAAIVESGAESMKDMGKVMAIIKPKVQGKADMGLVSQTLKQLLG